ncbi:MAG: DUF1294 domain-containing protein [Lachnospiraceae bacterium]|nr:DUF1294 domain-containing protein [Lachnospiraceae bacterium]
MKHLITYLLIANVIGLLSMCIDKSKARRGAWRIPEKTLFLIAACGGAFGSLAGMYLVRHKTRHQSFVIGMPALCLLWVGILVYLCRRFL